MKLTDKKINNPIPIGGAPFFADDILRIQENASAEVYSFFEGLTKDLPSTSVYNTLTTGTDAIKPGLIVSYPTIDKTDPANVIIGEFYYYVNEKLIYFAGGTFDFSLANPGFTDAPVLWFGEGTTTDENRIFNDSNSKVLFKTTNPAYYVGRAYYSGSNILREINSSVDLAKQYVCIGYLFGSEFGVNKNTAFLYGQKEIFGSKSDLSFINNKIKPNISQEYSFSGAGGSNTDQFTAIFQGPDYIIEKNSIVDIQVSISVRRTASGEIGTLRILKNASNIAFSRQTQEVGKFVTFVARVTAEMSQGDAINAIFDSNDVGDTKEYLDGNITIIEHPF